MSKKRSWTDEQLVAAVKSCRSYAAVIKELGLVPAGGNYSQIQQRIKDLKLTTEHFLGGAWNTGLHFQPNPPRPLSEVLVADRVTQSYVLKLRLFRAGIKLPKCELCGWAERSKDGRIPVELDHINGNHNDNRLSNLRILCPNCHSLQPTHRGRNKKIAYIKSRTN